MWGSRVVREASRYGGHWPEAGKRMVSVRRRMGIASELFFYHTHQIFFGIAVGGLGSAMGAVWYFSKVEEDKRQQIDQLMSQAKKKFEDVDVQLAKGQINSQPIPFPVITALGWGIVFITTSIFAWNKARLRMQYRLTESVVNFSLNVVTKENKLAVRTLAEIDLDEVLPGNPGTVKAVMASARKTSPDTHFLMDFKDEDVWYILNGFANHVSSFCAEAHVASDLGIPVTKAWYRIAMCFDKDVERGQKIRVLVVSEETLKYLAAVANNEAPPLGLEARAHTNRLHQLMLMAKKFDNKKLTLPQAMVRVQLAAVGSNKTTVDEHS